MVLALLVLLKISPDGRNDNIINCRFLAKKFI